MIRFQPERKIVPGVMNVRQGVIQSYQERRTVPRARDVRQSAKGWCARQWIGVGVGRVIMCEYQTRVSGMLMVTCVGPYTGVHTA